jgi:hypothetical protein
MASLIRIGEPVEMVTPKNGNDFKLEELYKLLDCQTIETVNLSDGRIMVFDEEGKLTDKERNEVASVIFDNMFPHLPGDYIAGHAIICSNKEIL